MKPKRIIERQTFFAAIVLCLFANSPAQSQGELYEEMTSLVFEPLTGAGVVGDVTGDGIADFIITGIEIGVTGLFLFSGADGSNVRYLGGGVGVTRRPVGDLNGDGTSDYVFSLVNPIRITARSGIDDSEIWTQASVSYFPKSAGDVNQDGVVDIVDLSNDPSVVRVLSGVDGSLLLEFHGQYRYHYAIAVGDVNADGNDDLMVKDYDFDLQVGTVNIHSGTDGQVLFSYPALDFSRFSDGLGDVNGDGHADFIIGRYAGNDIAVDCYSGFDGSYLYQIQEHLFVVNSITQIGDIDGDDITDFAVCTTTKGATCFSGVDGTRLHKYASSNDPELGSLVLPLDDVNGDGELDVLFLARERYLAMDGTYLIDTDGDRLSDPFEAQLGTDPLDPDTDGDDFEDGDEVDLAAGTGCPDPLNPDSDSDLLLDGDEIMTGTQLCNPDTDDDGELDGSDPFPLIADLPSTTPKILFSLESRLYSVSGTGDVNGDGHDDMIISFRSGRSGHTTKVVGGAYGQEIWSFSGNGTASSSGVGDINGDGFADFLMSSGGSVTAYSGIDSSVLLSVPGSRGIEAGDTNNDGIQDFLALISDGNYSVALYSGADGALLLEVNTTELPGFAAAGDTNNDGYDDFLIGVPGAQNSYDPGMARVYSGFDSTVLVEVFGDTPLNPSTSGFGHSVSGLGDMNGDGFDDFIVGGSSLWNGNDPIQPQPGSETTARVYSGQDGAMLFAVNTVAFYATPDDSIGLPTYVSGAGDVDGDGSLDFIVGTPYGTNFEKTLSRAGSTRVHSGRDGSILFGIDGEYASANHGVFIGSCRLFDHNDRADVFSGEVGAVKVYSLKDFVRSSGARSYGR